MWLGILIIAASAALWARALVRWIFAHADYEHAPTEEEQARWFGL